MLAHEAGHWLERYETEEGPRVHDYGETLALAVERTPQTTRIVTYGRPEDVASWIDSVRLDLARAGSLGARMFELREVPASHAPMLLEQRAGRMTALDLVEALELGGVP